MARTSGCFCSCKFSPQTVTRRPRLVTESKASTGLSPPGGTLSGVRTIAGRCDLSAYGAITLRASPPLRGSIANCSKKKRNLPPSSRAATVGLVECAFGAKVVDCLRGEAEDLAQDLGGVRAHQRRGAVLL